MNHWPAGIMVFLNVDSEVPLMSGGGGGGGHFVHVCEEKHGRGSIESITTYIGGCGHVIPAMVMVQCVTSLELYPTYSCSSSSSSSPPPPPPPRGYVMELVRWSWPVRRPAHNTTSHLWPEWWTTGEGGREGAGWRGTGEGDREGGRR